jgi:hypothetical protein
VGDGHKFLDSVEHDGNIIIVATTAVSQLYNGFMARIDNNKVYASAFSYEPTVP